MSVPFSLTDSCGNAVNIISVSKADGFCLVLEKVWQKSTPADSRSIGDYATNLTISKMPNRSLSRKFLLMFGSSLGAHGIASLQNQSILSSGSISLEPSEVSHSIGRLIARNEIIVNVLKFFSMVLLIGGGSVLVFTLKNLRSIQ